MSRICTPFGLTILSFLSATSLSSAQHPCDAPEAGQWVKHIHGWVTSHDELGVKAMEWYGRPIRCVGRVTDEFDGVEFGELQLDFANGAYFRLETYPPESSVATLTDSAGFADGAAAFSGLKRYTADIGVDIDWSSPEVEEGPRRRVVTFWDPEEGLNASARLVYRDGALISVGFSLAL